MNFCLPASTFSETFGTTESSRFGFEAAAQRFGAWVLLFSRFSCFCGPEKKRKIIYTESTTTTTMANGLWLCVCSQRVRRSHAHRHRRSQRFFSSPTEEMNWNCYVSTISGYYFYYTNFSSIVFFFDAFLLLFFLVRHNHNIGA